MGFIENRIRDFIASEYEVPPNHEITVSGYLEWHCVWTAIPPCPTCYYCGGIPPFCPSECWVSHVDKTVEIYVNGVETTSATTEGDGSFHATLSFSELGTYRVKAYYAGSLTDKECWSEEITITVIPKDEYDRKKMQEMLMLIGGGIAVVGLIGGIAYYIERRREEELMLMLAAKR